MSLVFLDAMPTQRRVREVDGAPKVMARPVASLRIARPYFYFILRELVQRWNEYAAEERAEGHEVPDVGAVADLPAKDGAP